MSIHENIERFGNFTSSEIVALLSTGTRPMTDEELAAYKKEHPKSQKKNIDDGFGKAALTYIEEKNMERDFLDSLDSVVKSKPTSWGNLLESRPFDMLGLEYILCSQETLVHPTIPYWVGSPDGTAKDTVIDIKCPMTRKSFHRLVTPIYEGLTGMDAMNKIRKTHEDGETYYWQLVSNAILTGSKYAELVVYMPYLSELPEIRLMADGMPDVYWVWSSTDLELPHLKDGGKFKNLNIIRFEVNPEDKWHLTACVLKAGRLLKERFDPPSVLIASPGEGVTLIEPAK